MKSRNLIQGFILLMTIGALLIPSTVLAASGEGNGALVAWARSGKGAIHGAGSMTIAGSGELWILDVAGDSRIAVKGAGSVQEYPSGWVRYAGFDGAAKISTDEIKVVVIGYGVRMLASGSGKFALSGNGKYRTTGDGWTAHETLIELRRFSPAAEEDCPVDPEYECPEGYHGVVIEVCDVDEEGNESNCEYIYDCVED